MRKLIAVSILSAWSLLGAIAYTSVSTGPQSAGTCNGSTSPSNCVLTFGSGAFVVVGLSNLAPTVTSVADDSIGAYTQAGGYATSSNKTAAVFYGRTTAGSRTITVTLSGSTYSTIMPAEFTGVLASGDPVRASNTSTTVPVDQGSGVGLLTCGAVSATAGDLVVGAILYNNAPNFTQSGSWARTSYYNAFVNEPGLLVYQIAATTTSYSPAVLVTQSGNAVACVTVAFKFASASTPIRHRVSQ